MLVEGSLYSGQQHVWLGGPRLGLDASQGHVLRRRRAGTMQSVVTEAAAVATAPVPHVFRFVVASTDYGLWAASKGLLTAKRSWGLHEAL
jgi:hypothetical protein